MKTYSGFVNLQDVNLSSLELKTRGFKTEIDEETLTIFANEPTVVYIEPNQLFTLTDHGGGVVESYENDQNGSYSQYWVADKLPDNRVALVEQETTQLEPEITQIIASNLWNTTPIRLAGLDVEAFVRHCDLADLEIAQKNGNYYIVNPINEKQLQQDLINQNLDVILLRDWS